MSQVWGGGEGVGQEESCIVRSNTLWIIVTWDPLWTDRHDIKHYLTATSLGCLPSNGIFTLANVKTDTDIQTVKVTIDIDGEQSAAVMNGFCTHSVGSASSVSRMHCRWKCIHQRPSFSLTDTCD